MDSCDHLSGIASRASIEKRRVLMLCNDMGMGGGAEEQVIELACTLQSRGWTPRIVSLIPPSAMPPDFDRRGIALQHLGMRQSVPDPRSIFRLRRIIREFRPDVVHSHMPHANLLARAVRVIQPFPVLVNTLHALNMAGVHRDHSRVFETAHRLSDSWAECTTAICRAAADHYVASRAVRSSKMLVIHNGIHTRRFERDPTARQRLREELGVRDQFVWLAVGRLEVVKAYPTLLHAFAKLDASRQMLVICGVGTQVTSLHELSVRLGVDQRVKFLGLRSDIADVMSAADAFALSSDSEGLPLVLLQACAAGLPIVATDVGGTSEAVVNGINGYRVQRGNYDDFAVAMSRIAKLPANIRSAMSDAGMLHVKSHFEMDRVVDRWEKIYFALLTGDKSEFSVTQEQAPSIESGELLSASE